MFFRMGQWLSMKPLGRYYKWVWKLFGFSVQRSWCKIIFTLFHISECLFVFVFSTSKTFCCHSQWSVYSPQWHSHVWVSVAGVACPWCAMVSGQCASDSRAQDLHLPLWGAGGCHGDSRRLCSLQVRGVEHWTGTLQSFCQALAGFGRWAGLAIFSVHLCVLFAWWVCSNSSTATEVPEITELPIVPKGPYAFTPVKCILFSCQSVLANQNVKIRDLYLE